MNLLPVLHINLLLHIQLSWEKLLQVTISQVSDELKVLWKKKKKMEINRKSKVLLWQQIA